MARATSCRCSPRRAPRPPGPSARATAAWAWTLEAGKGEALHQVLFANQLVTEFNGWSLMNLGRQAGRRQGVAFRRRLGRLRLAGDAGSLLVSLLVQPGPGFREAPPRAVPAAGCEGPPERADRGPMRAAGVSGVVTEMVTETLGTGGIARPCADAKTL